LRRTLGRRRLRDELDPDRYVFFFAVTGDRRQPFIMADLDRMAGDAS
jgi:hypothetical protein